MNIPWKFKSFIFRVIDILKYDALLYFIQKNITKRASLNLLNIYKDSSFHIQKIKKMKKPLLLEFGAGKNLAQNLILSQYCTLQYVVDLKEMADLKQINEAAETISKFEKKIPFKKLNSFEELYYNYKIRYLSPFDMRKTNFENDYFDCCISTNTLEHIPKEDIIKIFTEIKRVCKKSASVLAYIDYSDHYAHTDSKIHNLNFLKYTTSEWKKFNHSCHFQNRLRHYDFI